jgi:putative oxidoreductase
MPVAQSTEYRERVTVTPRVVERERKDEGRKRIERPVAHLSFALGAATHAVLRIGAGLLFFLHGAPKLFGWFGGMGPASGSAELFSLMGLAGVLEVFGGLAIALGVFTRPVAVVLALEMLIAYFMAHAPRGPVPYSNGGELALLYLVVWAFLAGNGAGPWSVDAALRDRERATA